MKLHRKIIHNEKGCHAHDFCSYAQGQGRNQVRGLNCVSDISHNPTQANLMNFRRRIKHNEKVCPAHDLGSYAQGQGRNQVKGQNLVSAITQKLLKQI